MCQLTPSGETLPGSPCIYTTGSIVRPDDAGLVMELFQVNYDQMNPS